MSIPRPCHHTSSFPHLINGNFKLLKPEISASLSPQAYPIRESHGLCLQRVTSMATLGAAYLVQDTSLLSPGAAFYVATLLSLSDPQPIPIPLSLPSQKSLQTQEQLVPHQNYRAFPSHSTKTQGSCHKRPIHYSPLTGSWTSSVSPSPLLTPTIL
jgi:hypothetical protein